MCKKPRTSRNLLVKRTYAEKTIIVSTSLRIGDETPLIKAIDEILDIDPDNPVYLFAKSEAFYACMDGEKGQLFRKRVLEKDPDHFDARMREGHFDRWDGIYSYHSWDEQMTRIPDMVLAMQQEGMGLQIIRNGLELINMVIIPTSRATFPADIVDYQWKPVWVDTPYGPVFEHYAMLKLHSGKILRNELSISPYPLEPVHQRNGDMLIQRFCETNRVFIVFNDGPDVLFNKAYRFPAALKPSLSDIKNKCLKVQSVTDAGTRFQQAAQWYMSHSNLDGISFEGSGTTLSFSARAHPKKPAQRKPTLSGVRPQTVYADTIERKIIEAISENFGISENEIRANSETNFWDLGLDSLESVELVMVLEEEFNIIIPDEDLGQLLTVNHLVEYIALHT